MEFVKKCFTDQLRSAVIMSSEAKIGLHEICSEEGFSLYLSVRVFSTVILILDTVNKRTNITNRTEIC